MTNKEVAELAGVSSAAVSRYLNGGYLSAEKRERIAAAIEQTGYVPSANARILRTRKSNTVGVVLSKTDARTMEAVSAGLEKYLFASGYGTTIAYVGDDVMAEATAMRSLLERQIDGIVLVSTGPVPGDIELFERARVPVVIVGQRVRNINCVLFDVRGAAFDLASSLGCTSESRVAYIDAGDRRQSFDIHRRRGFVEGLASAGVEGDHVTILTGGFTVTSSYKAVRELLTKTDEFDYISCATDTHAAGAIKAIRELRGLGQLSCVPKVSGFGNDPILQAVAGPIPSVEFDYEECGIKAAEMMTALIKGTARSIMSLQLGYRVVGI